MKKITLVFVALCAGMASNAYAMSLCGKEGQTCVIPGGTKQIAIGHGTDAANGVPAKYVYQDAPGGGTKEFVCNSADFGWESDGYSGVLECYTIK